ncbi:MAG: hypothetical protein LBV40_01610 [Methanomicrobiales archaeon]|nr:hypothetical protein [Methanomicrobiales archaeon]
MGAILEEGIITKSDTHSGLSSENIQALAVFDALLEKLSEMAGDDAKLGTPVIRLADVLFLEESVNGKGKTPFLTALMKTVINNVPATTGGIDECYECASHYLADSVVTLFYISSNLMHDDIENFGENFDYLKYLTLEMKSYGIGNYGSENTAGYMAALQAAIDGWEEISYSPENNTQELVVFETLLNELAVVAGSDANSGDLFTRLTYVFFEESANEKDTSIFFAELMNDAINNAADSVGGDECYECAAIYLFDSVATLFSIEGNIMNDDQVGFVEDLAYLKYLMEEIEYYGGVDLEYIDAVQTAIGGWEEVYGTQAPSEVYVSEVYIQEVLKAYQH